MNTTLEPPKSTKTSASQTAATAPVVPEKKTPPARKIVFILLGIAIAVWAIRLGYHAFCYEKSDDAYLTAHLHIISPQVSGQVFQVNVAENQSVRAGDVLAEIDPFAFTVARDKARAAVAQAEAQLIQAEAVIPYAQAQVETAQARGVQAEAQVRQTAAQLALASSNLARTRQLSDHGNGAVTQADVDTAQSNFDSAQAADNAARANLTALQASIESSQVLLKAGPAQVDSSKAGIASAKAALSDAERQLSYTTLRAPADGRIGNKNIETGNRVQVGQSLFSIVGNNVWIVANFKETQLAHMKVGQSVDIEIDALPGRDFHGKIDSFSPGTGSLFTLLPPDNATGNFTKVVQRVPVKILLDPEEIHGLSDRLHPGLSAMVSVRIR